MDWRRRRAEEPRQLQVRHLMRVHTSLNDYSLWTFITRPSIEYKDDTFLSRGIYSITQGMALTRTEPQYGLAVLSATVGYFHFYTTFF